MPSPWQTTSPERSALFTVYQKLADYASSPSKEKGGQLDQVMRSADQELRKIADEVKQPSRFTGSATIQSHQRIKDAMTVLRQVDRTNENQEIMQQALIYGDALRDQLHQAKKLAKSWKYVRQ